MSNRRQFGGGFGAGGDRDAVENAFPMSGLADGRECMRACQVTEDCKQYWYVEPSLQCYMMKNTYDDYSEALGVISGRCPDPLLLRIQNAQLKKAKRQVNLQAGQAQVESVHIPTFTDSSPGAATNTSSPAEEPKHKKTKKAKATPGNPGSSKWKQMATPNGNAYWFNEETNESTWNNPVEADSDASNWEKLKTPDGVEYWRNSESGDQQWVAPDAIRNDSSGLKHNKKKHKKNN